MASQLGNIELHYIQPPVEAYDFGYKVNTSTFGRGEPVRLLLIDAGLEFKYVRIPFEEWPKVKQDLLAKNIAKPSSPSMYINGKYMDKAAPMMRYISRKLGRYNGSNDEESQLIDAYSDIVLDWINDWAFALFKGGDKVVYKESTLPEYLDRWECVLEAQNDKGPYLMGSQISYADFLLYHMLEDNNNPFTNASHPHLAAFVAAINNRPNLKEYLASNRV